MFEQSLVQARGLAARPWSLAASLTGQVALVSLAILYPMIHPEMLQKVSVYIPIVSPPRAYHPPAPQRTEPTRQIVTTRRVLPTGLFEPRTVPTRVTIFVDPPSADMAGPVVGPSDGVPFGADWIGNVSPVIAQIAGPKVAPAPRTVPTVAKQQQVTPPAAPAQVRKGGEVQAALLVYGPKPAYPPLARAARIQGTVHLAAIIDTEGRVIDLRATSGHPLLAGAAVDAVKHWTYKPTLLNGEPVEVVTEIIVTFTLQ